MRHRSNAEHHTTRTSPVGAVDWPVTTANKTRRCREFARDGGGVTAGKGTLRPSGWPRTAGNPVRWYDRIPRCKNTAQIRSQRFAVSS
jgi:hypothetical protein